MLQPHRQRLEQCPACANPAAGDGDRCIFCGAGLVSSSVAAWRGVYHPYSYADGLLANATLLAHGVTTRLKQGTLERVLLGNMGTVVEVAEGEHLYAQEVLRQLRGVRTDTEFREWQDLKQRNLRRRIIMGTVAAATATAALAGMVLWGMSSELPGRVLPSERSKP
jgi:hypothetical protein